MRDGEHGYIVKPDDSEGLSRALAKVLADPSEVRRLGASCRREIEERCALDVIANRLAALFDETLADARGPSRGNR